MQCASRRARRERGAALRALLCTFGTAGDVDPFIEVGRAIAAQGDEPLLLVNPAEREKVERAGLPVLCAGEPTPIDEWMQAHPNIQTLRGGIDIWRDAYGPMVGPTYHAARDAIEKWGMDVVLSHQCCLGSMWAAMEAGIGSAVTSLQPATLLSRDDPSQLTPMRLPQWLLGASTGLARRVMGSLIDGDLKHLVRDLGLPESYGRFFELQDRQQMVLALWSHHFRGRAADDPAALVQCGFPGLRSTEPRALSPLVRDMLESGPPTVVVGLGSSARNFGAPLYRSVAEACTRRGWRALLIGASQASIGRVPNGILASPAEPFGEVFRFAKAIVHHGGMGTCAQALASGRPSLVVPFFGDQFDNAERSRQLGVAETLSRARVGTNRVGRALARVLEDPAMHERAAAVRDRLLAEPDGAEAAAERLRDLAHS